jgi:N-acetyl-anhydromuramyl-L-alanine amidase AmpD
MDAMLPKDIEFIASPNFTVKPRRITAVVVHYTGSLSIDGTLAWFRAPSAEVSAHYVVGRDGRLVQMVKLEDVAWHAGRDACMRPDLPKTDPRREPGVNSRSIGIELVGTEHDGFTEAQYVALCDLVAMLVKRYPAITPERVVGHSQVLPLEKTDPEGPHNANRFDWARVRAAAVISNA